MSTAESAQVGVALNQEVLIRWRPISITVQTASSVPISQRSAVLQRDSCHSRILEVMFRCRHPDLFQASLCSGYFLSHKGPLNLGLAALPLLMCAPINWLSYIC